MCAGMGLALSSMRSPITGENHDQIRIRAMGCSDLPWYFGVVLGTGIGVRLGDLYGTPVASCDPVLGRDAVPGARERFRLGLRVLRQANLAMRPWLRNRLSELIEWLRVIHARM